QTGELTECPYIRPYPIRSSPLVRSFPAPADATALQPHPTRRHGAKAFGSCHLGTSADRVPRTAAGQQEQSADGWRDAAGSVSSEGADITTGGRGSRRPRGVEASRRIRPAAYSPAPPTEES